MIMISVPCDHRECENSPHWPYSLAALVWSRESTFLKTDKQIINLTYQKSQKKKNHELILDHNQRWALKNANLLTCYCVWPFLKFNYTYTLYIIHYTLYIIHYTLYGYLLIFSQAIYCTSIFSVRLYTVLQYFSNPRRLFFGATECYLTPCEWCEGVNFP